MSDKNTPILLMAVIATVTLWLLDLGGAISLTVVATLSPLLATLGVGLVLIVLSVVLAVIFGLVGAAIKRKQS